MNRPRTTHHQFRNGHTLVYPQGHSVCNCNDPAQGRFFKLTAKAAAAAVTQSRASAVFAHDDKAMFQAKELLATITPAQIWAQSMKSQVKAPLDQVWLQSRLHIHAIPAWLRHSMDTWLLMGTETYLRVLLVQSTDQLIVTLMIAAWEALCSIQI